MLAGDRPGLDFVVGRYRWIGDKQQGVSLRSFTFLQLTLPSQVPHVVLRNRRAGVFAGQGLSLRGSQRLSLEGDFDRTFQLHVPAGYERDALYIFTPDLMARFLDLAPNTEVELVGDKVIFYLGRSPRLWKAPRMRALMEAAGALQHKLNRQTTRYSDDRSGARAGGVALAGLRLHGGVPWTTVLMGLLAGLPTVAAAIVLFTTFN